MRVVLLSLNWVEYLIELGNALAARNHHVDLILKTDRVKQTVGAALGELVDSSVRVHLLHDRPRGLRDPRQLYTVARLSWLLRSLQPDVINLHEATNTYLPLCLFFAGKAPLILTVHDVATHPGEDSLQPPRQRAVRDYLRRRASAYILHGQRLRERFLSELGSDEDRVYSIPHGCYTTFRHWAHGEVEVTPNSVLFFGRIHQYKGLDVLLEASKIVAQRIQGYRLVIAGAGQTLDRHRSELARYPWIDLHEGYLSNEEVAAIFRRTCLVALPYTEGSQSGVVRIAYALGKPAIVTDVGSIAESVDDGVTGRVIPTSDAEALAAAIIEILSEPEKLAHLSRAAAAMPDGRLSWLRVAEKTEQVYLRQLQRR